MLERTRWMIYATYMAIRRRKMHRVKENVLDEYSTAWESYSKSLEDSKTIDNWMRIQGVEDVPQFCNVNGRVEYVAFDSLDFNRRTILQALRKEFPNAQSVTEYGCGLGRNLLFIKRHHPELSCYGYELCAPGVELAKSAAKKFNIDVQYSRLDYVNGSEVDYVFPKTDVAFTMYSLEQLPDTNRIALENILQHSNLGSIHLEPVPENYPLTFRGLVGRLDHYKADYLRQFDNTVSSFELREVKKEVINSAHNPLMFPTLYVLRKNS